MLAYQWLKQLVPARFIQRDNRFVAQVEVNGRRELAHVPNSGRMRELLVEGSRVYLLPTPGKNRATRYQLALVRYGDHLVAINSQLPNKLVEQQLQHNAFPWLNYKEYRREVMYKDSRFDFLVTGDDVRTYLEVKSVTLVEGKTAMFPDAPTERGRKHLQHLIDAVNNGYGAAVIFIVQRADAEKFAPNKATDPAFAVTFAAAVRSGVTAKAYRYQVDTNGITFAGEIPVTMDS
ncbi:MAG: DNA/RNA nuclease SfsA [Thermoanaerobacteraceae bacterium]|nr:DNA/RNA nuclease SfsA [Thermoanaerobacteraceae bacterium]